MPPEERGKERRVDIGTKITIAILIFCVTTILGLFINAVWSIACTADQKSTENMAEIRSINRYIANQDGINKQLTKILDKHDNRVRALEIRGD